MLHSNLFRLMLLTCTLGLSSAAVSAGNHPPGYWQMPGIHVPQSQYQAPIVDYYSGQRPQFWDGEQPIEHFTEELAKRSWMRFEYLHWDFGRPGKGDIGANVLNLDPTNPLQVFDNGHSPAADVGVSVFGTTGNLAVQDVPGARGTWGLDLNGAEFEFQLFGTGTTSDAYGLLDLAANRPVDTVTGNPGIGTVQRPNIVIPLLTDGQ
ncbi:MAG: hypothetical protein R3C49_26755, partial [Planctomycetaceae bacterium]